MRLMSHLHYWSCMMGLVMDLEVVFAPGLLVVQGMCPPIMGVGGTIKVG
jgi:hypothetical protein